MAAVVRETNAGFTTGSTTSTSISVSHNHTTGNFVLATVFGSFLNSSAAVSGVNYNSSAMTLIGANQNGVMVVSAWYASNPTTGTNTVTASFTTAPNKLSAIQTYSVSNVNTTSPIVNTTDLGGITTAWTANLNTDSSGLMFMVLDWDDQGIIFTTASGAVLLRNTTCIWGRVVLTEKAATVSTGSIGGLADSAVNRPVFAFSLGETTIAAVSLHSIVWMQ